MKITKILFEIEISDYHKAECIHEVLKSIQDTIENKTPSKSTLKMITEECREIDPRPEPISSNTKQE